MAMSMPGASDLGLGADLSAQVKDETEEERKKRLRAQQASRLTGSPGASALGLGMAGGATAAGISPAGY
jgi:hypothetical protein